LEGRKLDEKVADIEVQTNRPYSGGDHRSIRPTDSRTRLEHNSRANGPKCSSNHNKTTHIVLQFLKMVFLVFIGVYILTLPAYYFLAIHMMSDALMPFEVMLCFASSFVSFVWVFKTSVQVSKEIRR
jgi:hypothetical protein